MLTARWVMRSLAGLGMLLGWMAAPHPSIAQVNSNQAQVQLTAQPFAESLTLNVDVATINFTLSRHALSPGDGPLTVSTDYVLDPSSTRTVSLYLYFADAAVALAPVGPEDPIPSNRVYGMKDAEGAFYAFDNPTPFSGGPSGLPTSLTDVSGSGNWTTTWRLQIDATGIPLLGPSYVGTLFIQAQVI